MSDPATNENLRTERGVRGDFGKDKGVGMKKGWQTKRLGDVCEIIKGRKPELKATATNGDLPYLVAKVMRGSKEAEYASVKDRNSITVEESETIIICDGSNSGEVFTGFRGILSSTMGKIAKKAEIDDDYLRAILASTFDVFNGAKTGAAIPHLDKEAMYQLQFPFPPVAEQQRIVGLLDEAFEGLATAKANAEKNLQNARALFESHLQSVFTQRGPGWVTKTFGEVLEIRNGRNQLEVESPDGEFPIYGSAGKVMGMATDYICEAGTTIIGRKGNINSPIYADTRFWNVDTAFGLASKAGMDSRFLYFFCLSYDFSAHNRGTTIPSLVKSELLNIPIPVPPPAEQQRIVGLLDSLQEETQRLARFYERKHAALEALKKSMLHPSSPVRFDMIPPSTRWENMSNLIRYPFRQSGVQALPARRRPRGAFPARRCRRPFDPAHLRDAQRGKARGASQG